MADIPTWSTVKEITENMHNAFDYSHKVEEHELNHHGKLSSPLQRKEKNNHITSSANKKN